MGMFILEIGLMTRLMEKVHICIVMEQNILEIGLKISNMEMVLKHGQIMLNMRGNTSMERKKEEESLTGQMVLLTMVVSF
jgi:ABC-type branched-subunit amino acid transport system ATPase component